MKKKTMTSVICILLVIAAAVGLVFAAKACIRQNQEDDKAREQELTAIRQSAFLRTALQKAELERNGTIKRATLKWVYDDGHYHVKEPWIIVSLTEDNNGDFQLDTCISSSAKGHVTEEFINSCKTVCFAFRDAGETAEYTEIGSSYSNTYTGTRERVTCYLYDVAGEKLFARKLLEAKELPGRSNGVPHTKVDDSDVVSFLKEHTW